MAFQVGGQIVEFPVLEGAPVAKGALIAQLDLEPFQRRLEQARLQKAQADRTVERLQKLSEAAVSQVSLEDAITAADLAELDVRDAEYALEHATLNAPFDGIVAAREVANFTTIQAGTPVVRLHDVSEWRIEIDVPEVLVRRVGQDPDIELHASFPDVDKRYPLELREFNAETSRVGQTFRITLAMLEEPGPGVLPGTSITVYAALPRADARVEIPPGAVAIASDGATSVMAFEPGEGETGTVRRQPVELTADEDGDVQVLSGLEPGTEIVAAGASALEDGQTVRRFAGFSN